MGRGTVGRRRGGCRVAAYMRASRVRRATRPHLANASLVSPAASATSAAPAPAAAAATAGATAAAIGIAVAGLVGGAAPPRPAAGACTLYADGLREGLSGDLISHRSMAALPPPEMIGAAGSGAVLICKESGARCAMKGDAARAAAGIARERGAFAAPFEGRKRLKPRRPKNEAEMGRVACMHLCFGCATYHAGRCILCAARGKSASERWHGRCDGEPPTPTRA